MVDEPERKETAAWGGVRPALWGEDGAALPAPALCTGTWQGWGN